MQTRKKCEGADRRYGLAHRPRRSLLLQSFLTHSNYNIIRSMSRAGTPTDNPIIESLNGWMKAELILDFGISKVSNLKKTLDQYVLYFNSERFAAALDYNPPIQYRTELGV